VSVGRYDGMRSSWLEETVRFYRGLGFFASAGDLPDAELAETLAAEHRETFGEPLPPAVSTPPLPDLLVMAKDPDRAWWLDLECEAVPGADVYVDAIERLALISAGRFLPSDVTEEWAGDGSRAEVGFALGDERHSITVRRRDDWFDTRLIGEINAILGPDGARFHGLSPGDQTLLVVMLTDGELAALRSQRALVPDPFRSEDPA
jgi:hypothetical protein